MSSDLGRTGATTLCVGLVIACTLLLVGCSSGTGGGATSGASGGPGVTPSGSYDVLTSQQIQATTAQNLWDAIRTLRPQWLRTRGRTSLIGQGPDEPAVYVGGARYESLSALRQMDVIQVLEVEFVDPVQATTRFGTGHTGGAIMVVLVN